MAKKVRKVQGDFDDADSKRIVDAMNELFKRSKSVDEVLDKINRSAKNLTKNFQEAKGPLDDLLKKLEKQGAGYSDLYYKLGNIQDRNKDVAKTIEVQNLALQKGLKIEEAEAIVGRKRLETELKMAGLSKEEQKRALKEYDILIKQSKELDKQRALAQKIQEITTKHEEMMESIAMKAHIFKMALTDSKVAVALIAAGLVKVGDMISEAYKELKEQGLSVSQALEGGITSLTESASTFGLVSSQAIRDARAAYLETGGTLQQAGESGKFAATMAAKFGGTAQDAAKAVGNLSKLPGMTKESAHNAAEYSAKLAIAAGIPADKVTKEMANNMDAVALAGTKNIHNLQKAIVNSQKLGVEFSKLQSAMDKLLNFESSINAQLEASVLLGREVNLDKARNAALAGDSLTVQQELLKAVGSEAEFNNLNYLQKQKLAEAMGVQVGDLAKMISGQKNLNDLNEEGAKAMNNQVESQSLIGNFLVKNAGAATGLLGSFLMLIPQMRMMQMMNKMGGGTGGMLDSLRGKVGGGGGMPDTTKLSEGTDKIGKGDKGPGFEKNMKGAAEGFKAMGEGRITLGIFNTMLAGPALLAALPGIPFLKWMGNTELKSLKENFETLASGLSAMGTGGAFKGSFVLLLANAAATVGIGAIPFLGFIGLFGEGIGAGLKGLASGLEQMGKGPVAIGIGLLSVLMLSMGASLLMVGNGIKAAGEGFGIFADSLSKLPFEKLIGLPATLAAIGVSLGTMAFAGLTALPVISGLTALGNSGLGGGGKGGSSKEENSEMSILINEVKELRKQLTGRGVINMDGRKVGEVIALAYGQVTL